MRFLTIPPDLAPAFGPLIYKVEAGPEEAAIDVEIVNGLTGELLGVKRFAGGASPSANVAGYVRRILDPKPLVPRAGTGFGFFSDAGRQAAVIVRAEDAVAPERVFTCALEQVKEFDILSRMPLTRRLAEGEWDEISIAVPDTILSATMRVMGDGVDITLGAENFNASRGVATLVVDSMDIVGELARMEDAATGTERPRFSDCRMAEVKIYAHDELVGEVSYELCGRGAGRSGRGEAQRGSGQRRICWLNALGGIDYYTFRSVAAEGLAVSRQCFLSGGEYRTVAYSAERSYEIVSDYCAPPLSDALVGIVCSPRVWMIEETADGERAVTPLDVVTDKVSLRSGELFSLRLTVREQNILNYQSL